MSLRPRTFDTFAAESADGLLRTAYLMTGDAGEAEDLVQECLVRVALRWAKVGEMDHPLAYTRRVLVALAGRGARKRALRREALVTTNFEATSNSAELDGVEVRDEVRAALRKLNQRQRTVLVLRYFTDLTEEQTAEVIGCKIGTIKSATSRAFAELRKHLEPLQEHVK